MRSHALTHSQGCDRFSNLLRLAGVSFEVRGLIYIAVGITLLWNCRRYWIASAQLPQLEE